MLPPTSANDQAGRCVSASSRKFSGRRSRGVLVFETQYACTHINFSYYLPTQQYMLKKDWLKRHKKFSSTSNRFTETLNQSGLLQTHIHIIIL
jgi:hypothetical protein